MQSTTPRRLTPNFNCGRKSPDIPLLISSTPRLRRRSSSILSASTSSANGSRIAPTELPYLKPIPNFLDLDEDGDEDSGTGSDSSLDLDTPFAHIMMRDGYISPRSRVVTELVPPGSASAGDRTSTASVRTKSGWYKDERDTVKRRFRHRDGNQLRGGIGLTTGLGWSDSEDEDAPSVLTRRLSTMVSSRRTSSASLKSTYSALKRSLSPATIDENYGFPMIPRQSSPAVSLQTQFSTSSIASSSRPVTPESSVADTTFTQKSVLMKNMPSPVLSTRSPPTSPRKHPPSPAPSPPAPLTMLRQSSLPMPSLQTTVKTTNPHSVGIRPLQLSQNSLTLNAPPIRTHANSAMNNSLAPMPPPDASPRPRTTSESSFHQSQRSRIPSSNSRPNSPNPRTRIYTPPQAPPTHAPPPPPTTNLTRKRSRVGSGMMYKRTPSEDLKHNNGLGSGLNLKRLDLGRRAPVEMRVIPPSPNAMAVFEVE